MFFLFCIFYCLFGYFWFYCVVCSEVWVWVFFYFFFFLELGRFFFVEDVLGGLGLKLFWWLRLWWRSIDWSLVFKEVLFFMVRNDFCCCFVCSFVVVVGFYDWEVCVECGVDLLFVFGVCLLYDCCFFFWEFNIDWLMSDFVIGIGICCVVSFVMFLDMEWKGFVEGGLVLMIVGFVMYFLDFIKVCM